MPKLKSQPKSHRLLAAVAFALSSAMSAGTVPANEILLKVHNPDGTPAAGAQAVLAPSGRYVTVTDGKEVDDDKLYTRQTVAAGGTVKFPAQDKPYTILLLSDAGYAEVRGTPAAVSATDIKLTPWCSLSGDVRAASAPTPDKMVSITATHKDVPASGYPTITYETSTTTNKAGHFTASRLPAGEVSVERVDLLRFPGLLFNAYNTIESYRTFITLEPGQPGTVTVAAAGRTVMGQFVPPAGIPRSDLFPTIALVRPVIDEGSPMPKELLDRPIPEQAAWWTNYENSTQAKDHEIAQSRSWETSRSLWRFISWDDHNGFLIEDLPPGKYYISFDVTQFSAKDKKLGPSFMIRHTFSVPADGTAPVNLGELPLSSNLKLGDPAPDFDIPGIDGKPVKLSDYRGKYVLLDFWATWCGPCVRETPNLKAIHDKYAKDGRLVLIGLSKDITPDKLIDYVKKNDITWPQGFLGNKREADGIDRLYKVTGIPAIYLIGPDGKVIASGLREKGIADAVEKALNPEGNK